MNEKKFFLIMILENGMFQIKYTKNQAYINLLEKKIRT